MVPSRPMLAGTMLSLARVRSSHASAYSSSQSRYFASPSSR